MNRGTTMTWRRILLGLAVTLISVSVCLPNELNNPGFEETSADRATAWTPYGRGYALEATEVQSGQSAVCCETTGDQDGMGIAQVIRYDQPDKRPIIVGGWSRAEHVGPGGDYCLYLDVIYDDGTPLWGKTAAWTRGTHGWQYTAEVYHPEKPVREIRAYVFLRGTKGKVWFDDVFLDRGGLRATHVRMLSDFPRHPHGQRIRARLTEAADWRAALLDSGGREVASSQGRGEMVDWGWQDAAESRPAQLHLTGQAGDGARLDLTVPIAVTERPENPVREGYVVWGENSMRKVYPTEYPPDGQRSELTVSLARNESEGLQVAITPADRVTLRDVQVSVGALTNEHGDLFPPESITAHLVGYIYVETPSGHPDAPSEGNWCPEVLLPPRPFEVLGGRTQTVWVSVHASDTVAAGVYRGQVVVTAAGAPATELPVSVRVRRLTLPRSPRMKTAFAMMDGFTRAAYGEITPALRRQCLDLMLSHRLNPDDISRTDPPAVADLLYAQDRGLTAFNILNLVPRPQGKPLWTCYAELKDYPADFREYLAQRLDGCVEELRQHGLSKLAYFYGFDERGPEYDELIKGICQFLKQRYPEVSTFTTAGYMYEKRRTTPPEHQDYMDWYCPLTSVYDPELSARLREQGKQVWWYVCCGPQHPYANFAALDYPSIEGRLLGWMTYGFQADGLLFWHVNLWHPNRIIDSNDPYLDWKPVCIANMTGDGCLTYPTPAGPVSSIRLENIRDGLEDYDYLALLADAQGQEAAKKYVGRLVKSMTDFTRDPAALTAVRDEIADQLEMASGL
ncbi:MAG: glycoside hydrolase domain-containing protein [Pirellulaceae bacterium]